MPVQCAKCGEELMGAVNRCWRCGQEFAARGTGDLPPVRRAVVAESTTDAVLLAQFSDSEPTGAGIVGDDVRSKQLQGVRVRQGSPFGDRGSATMQLIDPGVNLTRNKPSRSDPHHQSGGATASAALSLPLGVISLVLGFLLPLAGLVIALIGIGLSVWGLFSHRRRFAIAGLLLCCLGFAVTSVNSVVEIYTSMYGIAPWE